MSAKCEKPGAVYRNRLLRYPDKVWLIWSNKWGCWYRDDSCGYTNDIVQAGLYDRATAAAHFTPEHLPRSHRDTEPFPLSAVRAMLMRRRQEIEREAVEAMARIDRALTERLAA